MSGGSNSNQRKLRVRLAVFAILAGLAVYCVAPSALIAFSKRMIANREHRSASQLLHVAKLLRPYSAEVHYQLARVHRRLRRNSEFEVSLARARDAGLDELLAAREETLFGMVNGDYPQDVAQWRSLLNEAGSDLPEVCEGFVYFRMQRFETTAAMEILDAWQEEYPISAQAYFLRGKILYALERKNEATQQFRQAAELDSDNAAILLDLGRVLLDRLQFQPALHVLETCHSLEPDNAEVTRLLADAYSHTGNPTLASELLQHALTDSPDDPELLYALGTVELTLNRTQPALKCLQEAAALRPTERKIRYEFGRALRQAGREAEAKDEFEFVERATEAVMRLPKMTADLVDNPQDQELRFEIAKISWTYESRENGARFLHDLLAINPNHLPALELLKKHYQLQGDMEKAESIAQRILRIEKTRS